LVHVPVFNSAQLNGKQKDTGPGGGLPKLRCPRNGTADEARFGLPLLRTRH